MLCDTVHFIKAPPIITKTYWEGGGGGTILQHSKVIEVLRKDRHNKFVQVVSQVSTV